MEHAGSVVELAADRMVPKPCWADYYVCTVCGLGSKAHEHEERYLMDYYTATWQMELGRPIECFESAAAFIEQGLECEPMFDIDAVMDVGGRSPALINALKKTRLPIAKATLLDANPHGRIGHVQAWFGNGFQWPEPLQLITATHVLEHAISPRRFMRDVSNNLMDGGYAYIEVPSAEYLGNYNSNPRNEDINRNHLYHFTIPSLASLARLTGFSVLRLDRDEDVTGWPVNRALLRKGPPFSGHLQVGLHRAHLRAEKAVSWLKEADPSESCLYGISNDYVRLRDADEAVVSQFRIFDRYKAGQELCGTKIEDPGDMKGFKFAWIATAFRASALEIRKDLAKSHPKLIVRELW